MPTRTRNPNVYVALKIVPDQDDLEDTTTEVLGVFKSKQSADQALFKEHERMKKEWLSFYKDVYPESQLDDAFEQHLAEDYIQLIVVRKTLKP